MSQYGVKIVDALRGQPEGLTKKALADSTGIAWGTLFKRTGELVRQGILIEGSSKPTAPGRPGVPLAVNAESAYWCGIDIGAKTTKILFCDMNFQIVRSKSLPTERYTTPLRFFDWIDQAFRNALAEAPAVAEKLVAVGIALSGNVDSEQEILVSGGNFGMKYGANLPLARLHERWQLPLCAAGTMSCAALAEYHWGRYAGTGNLVAVGLGVGIGSGVIANHAPLLSHPRRPVGYIGHILIPGNSHTCSCGFTGCLEAYSGGEYLKLAAQEELPEQPELWDAARLDRAAADGIAEATRIMTRAASYNAAGIAALIQLYSPEAIVFSGGQVWQEGFLYTTTLKKLWDILPAERRRFEYSISSLGPEQSALGAARLAYEKFF
jgi:N-acetylglucosamine repressor